MTEVPRTSASSASERGLGDRRCSLFRDDRGRGGSVARECGTADPGLAGSTGSGSGQPRQSRTPDARWCIAALAAKGPELARSVDEQIEVIEQLRAEVDRSYSEAVRTVQVQTADGTLLREVLRAGTSSSALESSSERSSRR